MSARLVELCALGVSGNNEEIFRLQNAQELQAAEDLYLPKSAARLRNAA